MAVLAEKQVLKPYIKKAAGYIKSLLSAQHVEMNNGITLQSAVDEINNNLAGKSCDESDFYFRTLLPPPINICVKYASLASCIIGGCIIINL